MDWNEKGSIFSGVMQNDDEKTFDVDGYKYSYGKFHGTYFYILPEFKIKSKL